MMAAKRVCILGGGVSGLSSALAITERLPHLKITVVADKWEESTTSDGAFGFWQPHLLGKTPPERIRHWARLTLQRMTELARSADGPEAGVYFLSGYLLYNLESSEERDKIWQDLVPFLRHLTREELAGYGQQYRLTFKGVKFLEKTVSNLEELYGRYDVIVNCTGLGSRTLLNDTEVYPIRGQGIRVEAPWVKHFVISDDECYYMLPGINSVMLGGTGQENNWNTNIDEDTKKRIFEGCCHLEPSLKKARVIRDWTGLRPGRTQVRVEAETVATRSGNLRLVHNYGHGGSGITLSWGCALDVANLVQESLSMSSL